MERQGLGLIDEAVGLLDRVIGGSSPTAERGVGGRAPSRPSERDPGEVVRLLGAQANAIRTAATPELFDAMRTRAEQSLNLARGWLVGNPSHARRADVQRALNAAAYTYNNQPRPGAVSIREERRVAPTGRAERGTAARAIAQAAEEERRAVGTPAGGQRRRRDRGPRREDGEAGAPPNGGEETMPSGEPGGIFALVAQHPVVTALVVSSGLAITFAVGAYLVERSKKAKALPPAGGA